MAYPPLIGFKSRKAAQIAAYFACKNNNAIEKLKLIKLIYLAERNYLARAGHPMLYDEMYSLPHGPVCSSALNGINGQLDKDIWAEYITRKDRNVFSNRAFTLDELDEFSDEEIEALDETWESFGWMSAAQIRKYTHKNCPEYTEVEGGRLPISYKEIFEAVGISDGEVLEEQIDELRRAKSLLTA